MTLKEIEELEALIQEKECERERLLASHRQARSERVSAALARLLDGPQTAEADAARAVVWSAVGLPGQPRRIDAALADKVTEDTVKRLDEALSPLSLVERAGRLRASKHAKVRRHVDELATAAGMPKHVALRAALCAEHITPTPAVETMVEIVRWRNRHRAPVVAVLAGPPGVGKTVAVCAAALRGTYLDSWDVQLPQTGSVRRQQFVTAASLATTAITTHSESREAWDHLLSIPVLVIDDAGTEPGGDLDLLSHALLARYDQGAVTLVTTNITSRAAFLDRYANARVLDRLREQEAHGCPWWREVKGKSLRW